MDEQGRKEIETKIAKYRQFARQAPDYETAKRILDWFTKWNKISATPPSGTKQTSIEEKPISWGCDTNSASNKANIPQLTLSISPTLTLRDMRRLAYVSI